MQSTPLNISYSYNKGENGSKKSLLQQPQILLSEFGELLNVKPMTKLKNSDEPLYKEVEIVGDNTKSKDLLKKMNRNPKAFFLFSPKGHFINAQTLYKALKKQVNEQFYHLNAKAKKQNKEIYEENKQQEQKSSFIKEEEQQEENLQEMSFKGSVFEKCQLPSELFNINRMIKMNVKQYLSRIGFLTLRDGTIDISGESKPELSELKNIVSQLEFNYNMSKLNFKKPDYFTSFPFIEGVISADNYKTQGIKIRCLNEKLIYPLYGVWSPTNQEYLDLFSNYVQQSQHIIKRYEAMADLGCGTGILPIVLSEKGGFTGTIYSFDKQGNCIESTKLNSQIFGLSSRINTIELDLVEFYYQTSQEFNSNKVAFYQKVTNDLNIPMQFDLITCNPPWIPSTFVAESSPLDNGVYDPNEEFLLSSFNFAKIHLSSRGEMILIYSDLAYNLGLQEEQKVEKLAYQFGMRAELVDSTKLQLNKRPLDPLKAIKRDSKTQLYRVTKN